MTSGFLPAPSGAPICFQSPGTLLRTPSRSALPGLLLEPCSSTPTLHHHFCKGTFAGTHPAPLSRALTLRCTCAWPPLDSPGQCKDSNVILTLIHTGRQGSGSQEGLREHWAKQGYCPQSHNDSSQRPASQNSQGQAVHTTPGQRPCPQPPSLWLRRAVAGVTLSRRLPDWLPPSLEPELTAGALSPVPMHIPLQGTGSTTLTSGG